MNRSDYHPKWSLISRLVRKHRAKDKCEQCGAANWEPHPETGSRVVLAVAHLDQDRKNNRFWNLKAMCQVCHFAHDRKANIMRRRYGKNYNEQQFKLDL